jgi:nicotinamide phosphoribosyltransferase
MKTNIVTLTDSYKLTHHNQYPAGTEKVYSYFEARPGAEFDKTTFFGLQMLIKENLLGAVVTKEGVDKAEKLAARHFGNADLFKRERWDYIVDELGGKLPIEIRAVAEGTVVPVNNVMMTVVNTDPKCSWLTNHLETLLTHVWSASTVATLSRTTKELYKRFLNYSCDEGENFAGLPFMLHDFGMRGVSSMQSAGFEGAGHLLNFLGTDTVIAMEYVDYFYNGETGFSIPATEHSVMTSRGPEGEGDVIGDLLDNHPTGLLSIVSDSYDIYNCVLNIYGGRFKEQILARDGKLVVRPDSGDPLIVVPRLLEILADKFGYTTNKKGYKVLNPKIGLIWGDGIDIKGIEAVLEMVIGIGFSAENLVFGMGGGLLQKINRDTQRFAFKCSAQYRGGEWKEIFKDPLDKSKASKRGRLKLVADGKTVKTVKLDEPGVDLLVPVFRNGELLVDYEWETVVNNTNK